MGVYIHIPFCTKKCAYCDFLSAPADENLQEKYIEALISEIKSYKTRTSEYQVATIFLGGGTPSLINSLYIEQVLNELREVFYLKQEPEVTIEINPGTIDRDKLYAYKSMGINRLSFGLQSTSDNELKILGRSHSYKQFYDNYILARELGFNNINVDLISALPNQSLSSWKQTLKTVSQLRPEHISAYSLIIEEGTPFFDLYSQGKAFFTDLPDEETDRSIYQLTQKTLQEYGYNRYEISNYAKEGFECKHNTSYWIGTEYLGLGLGSASLLKANRFQNESNIKKYITLLSVGSKESVDIMSDVYDLRRNIVKLSKNQLMEEFMFLGLRLQKGISKKEFKKRFHIDINDLYEKTINKLCEKQLLICKGDRIFLTNYGIDISNYVLSHFLLD